MYQAPQHSRTTRSSLSAATTRAQQAMHSMRAQMSQSRLDQELASGVRPDTDPLLRERARQLLSRDSRLKMASGLGQALHQGERHALITPQVPVRSRAVQDAAPILEMVASRLRGSLPIGPQGAAKTKILLTDGSGPLYNPNSESDLKAAAGRALAALDVDSGRGRAMPRRVGTPAW